MFHLFSNTEKWITLKSVSSDSQTSGDRLKNDTPPSFSRTNLRGLFGLSDKTQCGVFDEASQKVNNSHWYLVVKSAKSITQSASKSSRFCHEWECTKDRELPLYTHTVGHLYNFLFSFFHHLAINCNVYNQEPNNRLLVYPSNVYTPVTFGNSAKNKSESKADRVLLHHLYTLRWDIIKNIEE